MPTQTHYIVQLNTTAYFHREMNCTTYTPNQFSSYTQRKLIVILDTEMHNEMSIEHNLHPSSYVHMTIPYIHTKTSLLFSLNENILLLLLLLLVALVALIYAFYNSINYVHNLAFVDQLSCY